MVGTVYPVPQFHPLAMVGGAVWASVNFVSSQRCTSSTRCVWHSTEYALLTGGELRGDSDRSCEHVDGVDSNLSAAHTDEAKPPLPILPPLLSGILWGVAQSSWFIANAALGEPISFPIVTTCTAVIATLVGVVIFNEIKVCPPYILCHFGDLQRKRNFMILGVAMCVAFIGILINAFSL
ncbi:hypothetical protein TSMEX_000573 [Taenia solium]|eukprot:TsM_001049900 transcript=TsM_001049900 gene=TsM_001049900